MAYALRAGLSVCEAEGRLIFLDLPADRYFCLAPPAETAFRRIWHEDPCEEGDSQFAERCGLFTEAAGASIAPCPAPATCKQSLLEEERQRARPGDVAMMLASLARASCELRMRGLAASLARFETAKARATGDPGSQTPSTARLMAAASALRASMRLVSFHERCLPASLALAMRLARAGIPVDLVLGVRLAPFKAHAWVQHGETLVNERLSLARLFTPILVL